MLDIKWIRENPKAFDNALIARGMEPLSEKVLTLDKERREMISLIQELQHARKQKSQAIGMVKDKTSKSFENAKANKNENRAFHIIIFF